MNNLSIKKKLLLYSFFIQLIVLTIFSISLYKAIDISTLDKLHSTLKVITLDVADDLKEHKDELLTRDFDEEKEFKFEPLYIRLLQLDNKINIITSSRFPTKIVSTYANLDLLEKNKIVIENQESFIISRIKTNISNKEYVIEVATNNHALNSTLENLLYILLFIIPIILLLSTIGGYFLIYKSFLPIGKIINNLHDINANNLSKRLATLGNNDEIDLLAKEINSLIVRLEISFDKISQFSSDASHELKTPLTIIRGEIEVGLRKDRTNKEYKEILNNCLDELLIIQQTIDDLLFLAKSEQQLGDIGEEDIYLDEITLDAVSELTSFAKLKDITLSCDIKDAMQIKGHPKLLKVAIKNILKNSISFSHDKSDIIIENYKKNDKHIILVKDFGIGIEKNEQKKIFEKFYRTDKSRNKNSGGTGLGMSICEKIVKMHHGKIKLHSKENEGTTVTLIF